MAKKQKTNGYPWKYCSLGGVVRVNITSGEDIAHLGELDQKLWTVLSCPTKDLELDSRTLQLIDTDGDGRVRVAEIVAAAQWLPRNIFSQISRWTRTRSAWTKPPTAWRSSRIRSSTATG